LSLPCHSQRRYCSPKKDSTAKVGNILNLEGGLGADFLGGGLTAGLAYYGTFKLTEDRFDALLPSLLIRGKNRIWGLGPEVSLAIAANKTVYGFVTVRYQWDSVPAPRPRAPPGTFLRRSRSGPSGCRDPRVGVVPDGHAVILRPMQGDTHV
jgi:hypothetical protein